MRLASIILLAVLGCGGPGPHDPYPTLHACYNDLRDNGQTQQMALLSCLLDHPINGAMLNFPTLTDCISYVTEAITNSDLTADIIDAECQDYIDMHQ